MERILRVWMDHQCRALPGIRQAVLLRVPANEGPRDPALLWPDESRDWSTLSRVAQAALHLKQPVIKARVHEVENTGEPVDALACPLALSDRFLGVFAVEITHCAQPMHQELLQQIQAGVQWLETMIRTQGPAIKEQLVNLVELVAAAMDHERFKAAVTEVANQLAQRLSCRQVSLGFLSRNRMRVEAISDTCRVDPNANLVRAIRDAMCEATDQAATIVYPETIDGPILVTRFHARLAQLQQGTSICTVPLIKNSRTIGALLMQRGLDKPFTDETIEQCEQIGVLLGPVLETRRSDERALPLKMLDTMCNRLGRLWGPRGVPLKAGLALTLLACLWMHLAEGTFRISSDSVLEAGICRAAVAPQQGYITSANVRAGDLVREGELLATLDDRELLLEQRKWQSQRTQLMEEYRKALARSDRAEVAILEAKRLQAEAQLNLVKQQLERIALVAPFSGLIVKGDLSQSLGSPVERGQVLFEIAPIDQYRVVLKVDERDIAHVKPGQQGWLKLSGMPEKSVGITVDRLTPIATGEGGRNYFRVEALMEKYSDLMRPGMEGIAKIEVGRQKLLWIWTRRLVDWFRLFVWSRLP